MADSELRALRVRLAVPLGGLVLAMSLGVAGYSYLWRGQDATLLDAVYMTFITITTIGFFEVHPLAPQGRVLTMLVGAIGIGSLFYLFGVVMDYLVSMPRQRARRERKMESKVAGLSEHFIIAGLGRVGQMAAEELAHSQERFVVVDPSEHAFDLCAERGWLGIKGDASVDETLERCGVRRAKGLIVTTANDATNLFVILSARMLAPKLFIVSRALDEASVAKLVRAGADRAESPYAIGGKRLANLMLNPHVVDFFETALRKGSRSLNISDIVVTTGTTAVGRSLETLRIPQLTGATILAVLRSGTVVPTRGDLCLEAGDHIFALGTADQLEQLERILVQA